MAKKRTRRPKLKPGEEFVCKCECGGNVIGVREFGRLWTWCDKCSPVETVHWNYKDGPYAKGHLTP